MAESDAMLFRAVKCFVNSYIAVADDGVKIPKALSYTEGESARGAIVYNSDDTVTLYLSDFTITYDSANSQLFIPSVAKAFAARVDGVNGMAALSEDSDETKMEILFGKCDREHFVACEEELLFRDYYLCVKNNKLSVSAYSIYGYARAIEFLIDGFSSWGITIPVSGYYGDDAYGNLYKNYENPSLDDAWMLNVAHRGDVTSNLNPENSLPSFTSCIDNCVDVIETDLKLTKDGVWVICHDTTLDRTTNGKGAISEMTYDEIKKYFLLTQNGGSGASVTDYKVPTLEEVIDLCKGRVILNLDHLDPSYYQEVYDVFEEKGAVNIAMFKGYWSASQLLEWYCKLISDGRELPLYMPMFYSPDKYIEDATPSFVGLTSIFESWAKHSSQTVQTISDSNIRMMCLTALNPMLENFEYYTELKEMGYTAIMTDTPCLLKEFIHGY